MGEAQARGQSRVEGKVKGQNRMEGRCPGRAKSGGDGMDQDRMDRAIGQNRIGPEAEGLGEEEQNRRG